MDNVDDILRDMGFSPHFQPDDKGDYDLIRNWPTLRWLIEERLKQGYRIMGLSIDGAAIVGKEQTRRPLQALATVMFWGPDNSYGSETITVMTPATTLYALYKAAGEEITNPLDQIYVHLAPQARIGPNKTFTTIPPGGIYASQDVGDISAPTMESLRASARREYREEALPVEMQGRIPLPDLAEISAMGPIKDNSLLTDQIHQFRTPVREVPADVMVAMREGNLTAGLAEEGEVTHPVVVPVYEAFADALSTGLAEKFMGLSRVLAEENLLEAAITRFVAEHPVAPVAPEAFQADPAYKLPEIVFDPGYKLRPYADDQMEHVLKSALLREKLEKRERTGFKIDKVTIKAVAFDKDDQPEVITAALTYRTPGQETPTGYHIIMAHDPERAVAYVDNTAERILVDIRPRFARAAPWILPTSDTLSPFDKPTDLGEEEGHPTPAIIERQVAGIACMPANSNSLRRIDVLDAFRQAAENGMSTEFLHLARALHAEGRLTEATATVQEALRLRAA